MPLRGLLSPLARLAYAKVLREGTGLVVDFLENGGFAKWDFAKCI